MRNTQNKKDLTSRRRITFGFFDKELQQIKGILFMQEISAEE